MSTTSGKESDTSDVKAHWSRVAKAYHKTQSPLHPCAEDIAAMEHFVTTIVSKLGKSTITKPMNALLLGATPAIATMAWPEHMHLTAVDQSEGMLQTIWPGDLPGVRTAKQGNWLELPIADGTCSVVVGDGSFNCIEYPTPYHRLAAEVARVLHDDGVLILRFYARPEQPLAVDKLFQDLRNGHFSTFDGFKFLLLMAMVDEEFNVAVRNVWQQWVEANVDQAALCHTTGWPMAQFETIAYYQQSLARFSFPPLRALEEALAPQFDLIDCITPTYPLGDCCPILLFRKRRNQGTERV